MRTYSDTISTLVRWVLALAIVWTLGPIPVALQSDNVSQVTLKHVRSTSLPNLTFLAPATLFNSVVFEEAGPLAIQAQLRQNKTNDKEGFTFEDMSNAARYEISEQLEDNQFLPNSITYRGTNPEGKPVVLIQLSLAAAESKDILRNTIPLLEELSYPGIPRPLKISIAPSTGHAFIEIPDMKSQPLATRDSLGFTQSLAVFRNIALTLQYLHRHHVAYGNVSLDSIQLDGQLNTHLSNLQNIRRLDPALSETEHAYQNDIDTCITTFYNYITTNKDIREAMEEILPHTIADMEQKSRISDTLTALWKKTIGSKERIALPVHLEAFLKRCFLQKQGTAVSYSEISPFIRDLDLVIDFLIVALKKSKQENGPYGLVLPQYISKHGSKDGTGSWSIVDNNMDVLNEWTLGSQIKKSSSVTVYRARRLDGKEVTLKYYEIGTCTTQPGNNGHTVTHSREVVERYLKELQEIRYVRHLNGTGPTKSSNVFVCQQRDPLNPQRVRVGILKELEWMEGQSLEATIATSTNAITLQKLLIYLIRAALSLHQIHNQNLIHRDIKPDNIIVLPYGQVSLIDFGITRLLDYQDPGTWIRGTPGFLAPEQVAVQPCGTPTDTYGLANTLFFRLITKYINPARAKSGKEALLHQYAWPKAEKQAFRERQGNAEDRLRARIQAAGKYEPDFGPFEKLFSAIPLKGKADRKKTLKKLVAVLKKALNRNPKKRYQTALELMQAFNQVLQTLPENLPACFASTTKPQTLASGMLLYVPPSDAPAANKTLTGTRLAIAGKNRQKTSLSSLERYMALAGEIEGLQEITGVFMQNKHIYIETHGIEHGVTLNTYLASKTHTTRERLRILRHIAITLAQCTRQGLGLRVSLNQCLDDIWINQNNNVVLSFRLFQDQNNASIDNSLAQVALHIICGQETGSSLKDLGLSRGFEIAFAKWQNLSHRSAAWAQELSNIIRMDEIESSPVSYTIREPSAERPVGALLFGQVGASSTYSYRKTGTITDRFWNVEHNGQSYSMIHVPLSVKNPEKKQEHARQLTRQCEAVGTELEYANLLIAQRHKELNELRKTSLFIRQHLETARDKEELAQAHENMGNLESTIAKKPKDKTDQPVKYPRVEAADQRSQASQLRQESKEALGKAIKLLKRIDSNRPLKTIKLAEEALESLPTIIRGKEREYYNMGQKAQQLRTQKQAKDKELYKAQEESVAMAKRLQLADAYMKELDPRKIFHTDTDTYLVIDPFESITISEFMASSEYAISGRLDALLSILQAIQHGQWNFQKPRADMIRIQPGEKKVCVLDFGNIVHVLPEEAACLWGSPKELYAAIHSAVNKHIENNKQAQRLVSRSFSKGLPDVPEKVAFNDLFILIYKLNQALGEKKRSRGASWSIVSPNKARGAVQGAGGKAQSNIDPTQEKTTDRVVRGIKETTRSIRKTVEQHLRIKEGWLSSLFRKFFGLLRWKKPARPAVDLRLGVDKTFAKSA